MVYCTKCGAPIADGDLFCSKCGTKKKSAATAKKPAVVSRVQSTAVSDNNATLVREYLRGAGELEYTKYQIQQIGVRLNAELNKTQKRIAEIDRQLKYNDSRTEQAKGKQKETVSYTFIRTKYKSDHSLTLGEYFIFLLIMLAITFAGAFGVPGFSKLFQLYEKIPFVGSHPFIAAIIFALGLPLLFSVLFNMILNAIARSKHNAEQDKAEQSSRKRAKEQQNELHEQATKEIADLKTSTEKLTAERQGLSAAYVPQLNKEIDENRQALAEIEADLKKYYSPGVLHPNYQALVPVTTMFQYFDTGRCSQLTGHEGAYNLYENELRLNTIVGKVDQLTQRVDRIAAGQQQILRRISSIGSSVSSLIGTVESTNEQNMRSMNKITGGISQLNTSAELQNYYAQSMADSTRHIDYMMSNGYYANHLY